MLSHHGEQLNEAVASSRRDAPLPGFPNVAAMPASTGRRSASCRSSTRPRASASRRPDRRGDARRHHRRHRRQSRQVQRRRPPDPDPRAADEDARTDLKQMQPALTTPTAAIPLAAVADVSFGQGPARSTATTASGGSSSASISMAAMRSATRGRRSSRSLTTRTCRQRPHAADRRRRDHGRGVYRFHAPWARA